MTRAGCGLLTCAIATLLAMDGALAQSPSDRERQAEELTDRGVALLSANPEANAAEALRLFEQADALKSSPKTIGQRGLAEQWLKQWSASEQHLSSALEGPSHPWVAKYRTVLENQLAKVRAEMAELAFAGAPAGAEIWLQDAGRGRRLGTLPLRDSVWVSADRPIGVQITAPGHQPQIESLSLAKGERRILTVALEKVKLVEITPPEADAATDTQEDGRSLTRNPVLGWSLAGLGAVGIVGGLVYAGPCFALASGHQCNRSMGAGLAITTASAAVATIGAVVIYRSRSTDLTAAVSPSGFLTVRGSL